ncbi:glycosyltransferase [Aquibacillus rhizosphaerae]|uniref:Glycosyltransferase n=1 Tax=Aquibacillus rhizosphaerae TaxID=3051431 RepID=A0ABT7L8Q1_9BACI|nr:glycosyltransferase [Aquibacillus sp. LR5S19]MDL4842261.1 glycosyltransferase [Aquibacillus sp. LR5S19]
MKVVLVTPNFHQPRGNTITVQRIADGLKSMNVDTEIVSTTEDTEMTFLPEADVVHGFHAYKFYSFMEKLDVKPKSYVLTLTGTDLNHNLFDKKTRPDVLTCLRNSVAIHVFNEEAKQTLLSEVPEVKEKTFMVPQGTEILHDTKADYQKQENTFLFVLPAGIRKIKNVPAAIEMMEKLHQKYNHVRLCLVGPILEKEEGKIVSEMVEDNNDWIDYLGQLPHEKMGTIYYQADCVLNTSHSEGQSSAILEAMAHGLPALVSDNQGNRSIVSHEKTGFIYQNSDQFLDYAEKIMNNNTLRYKIGESAKEYISQNHSSESEIKRLLKIYRKAL